MVRLYEEVVGRGGISPDYFFDRTDAKGSNSTMTAQFKGQGKLEKATGAGD